jgi:hypothetical protein
MFEVLGNQEKPLQYLEEIALTTLPMRWRSIKLSACEKTLRIVEARRVKEGILKPICSFAVDSWDKQSQVWVIGDAHPSKESSTLSNFLDRLHTRLSRSLSG